MGTTEGLESPQAYGHRAVFVERKRLKIKERLEQLNGVFPTDDAVLEGLRPSSFVGNPYQWLLTSVDSAVRKSDTVVGATLQ